MQQTIVAALERAIINLLPKLEPLLIQAARNVAVGLINAAKNHSLPERYKWLEPIVDQVGDQLLAAINQP